MSANKLSKELQVEKLKQPVIYRLLSANKIDEFTKRPMNAASVGYMGMTTIYDEHDTNGNYEKIIKYVTGTRPGLNGQVEEVIGRVDFDSNGHVTVAKNQQNLFEFMERDSRNASNPFRDKSVEALYERVDESAIAKKANERIDLELDALILIKDMPKAELVRYAKALDVDTNRDMDSIVHDMRLRAKTDPKSFIENSSSILSKVKAEVKDALEYGILEFDPADNKYIWKKEKNTLVIVPIGHDTVDTVVNFLVSDKKGEVAYKEIVKRLAAFDKK